MEKKYVVIIQCDIALKRCSGFACTDSFTGRKKVFSEYDKDVNYISMSCGGCCGKGVSSKLSHLSQKLSKYTDIKKAEVAVHLSSCMVKDNHHYDRCPHIDYIKNIIEKRGYKDVIEGSYISDNAERKREKGIYKQY